ncbi:DUF1569 domain-containing protein [Flavivirga rizhaonensis]|uniref:DUF1569 domain-containing protein n=1 Tax=Flavivirga rizhaonensis TaxID=2559571 RepID=A0A4S1DXC4_9FLAO|nr:DUF1569 domain-containing protein [Flavivirga rizhaonensis]TGV02901.1 DUF1569 domain-containing protein [Flavivirga rizhaonensis]
MHNKKIAILNNLLSQIEESIPFKDKNNPIISIVSIGWQLDHTLKVINRVCASLKLSNPKDYKKDFNIIRSILFTFCYIPRGKAKAPKIVKPSSLISTVDLHSQLGEAKKHINSMCLLDKNTHFKHFIFGILNKTKTLRFLEMHIKHHLKIVNDILRK